MSSTKRAALYLRVSTNEQSTELQESELRQFVQHRGWTVFKTYIDKISGTTNSRPALDELMADCRRGRIDAVLCWKFDRFSRSLRHLITVMEEFKRLNIAFISATEGIDTTIPSGELVFQIFGAIAQFERTLICERVKAGLAHAKSKGVKLGRPPKVQLDEHDFEEMRAQRAQGATLRQLAAAFGCSIWTAYRATKNKPSEI